MEETVKELRKLAEELEQKKAQTDHLLFERIPSEIAEKVRQKQAVVSRENFENKFSSYIKFLQKNSPNQLA